MPKHKSEDYKLSAVQYYLENDVSYVKTCEIFNCFERSLKGGLIDTYQKIASKGIIDYQYLIKLRKNM